MCVYKNAIDLEEPATRSERTRATNGPRTHSHALFSKPNFVRVCVSVLE